MSLPTVDEFGSYSASLSSQLKALVAGFPTTASLVCDSAGNTISKNGNSRGLATSTDLSLLISLRRKSQVVLTSGKTFEADNYTFPKSEDLAVLTNRKIDIEVPKERELVILDSGYAAAISDLRALGYASMHTEFGLTGVRELVTSRCLDALFLSSNHESGVHKLADELAVTPTMFKFADLSIGLVAWQ